MGPSLQMNGAPIRPSFRTTNFVTRHAVHFLRQFLDLARLTAFSNRGGVGDPGPALKDERIPGLVLQNDKRLSVHDGRYSLRLGRAVQGASGGGSQVCHSTTLMGMLRAIPGHRLVPS